jgi:hypothetical protein
MYNNIIQKIALNIIKSILFAAFFFIAYLLVPQIGLGGDLTTGIESGIALVSITSFFTFPLSASEVEHATEKIAAKAKQIPILNKFFILFVVLFFLIILVPPKNLNTIV